MELDDGTTLAERKLRDLLTESLAALRARDYESLEGLLTSAALDARSLRLLGPEGSQGIPVDHATVGSLTLDEIVEVDVLGQRHYMLTAEGLDALGRPDLAMQQRAAARARLSLDVDRALRDDDSPAGAGHSVEADRG